FADLRLSPFTSRSSLVGRSSLLFSFLSVIAYCSSSSSNAFRGLKQIAQGSTYPCIFSRLIMSDLDPDPVVQLNPQTSSNVNVENPQTHSISG
ncbi:hypothetical protein CUMW_167670, partial [Citrus unshiu]